MRLAIVVAGLAAMLSAPAGPVRVRAQALTVPADTVIRLERTACFGPCPIYTVEIDARGTVTYVGGRFVRVTGRQTAQIAASVVAKLLETAERIRFSELHESYRVRDRTEKEIQDGIALVPVTDLPTTFISIAANGRTKRIEDYNDAPKLLTEFEREVDEAAGTMRWIR